MSEIKRPGVIIYFDAIRPSVSRMSKEQIADLFMAILDYAEYGIVPELDLVGSIVFDMLRPKIDIDAEKYVKDTLQKMYAAYCREEKRFEREPLKFPEWKTYRLTSADDDRHQYISISENETEPISETITVNENTYPSTTGKAIGIGCGKEEEENPVDFEEMRRVGIERLREYYRQ